MNAVSGMSDLVRSELTKARTVRSARWVLAAEVALLVLVLSGAVASGGLSTRELATAEGVRRLLEHGGLVAILTLAVGVLVSAGEFRHGTVVDTFLTEPRRGRVLVAKLVVGAVIGSVAGVVVGAAATVTAWSWYQAEGISLDLASATVSRSLLGIVAWQMLYCLLGVALGTVIRSPVGAMVVAVGWLYLAETGVGQLVSSLARWLPATAARATGYDPSTGLLPQAGAVAVLAGWVLMLGAAGAVAQRRDVT